MGLKRKRSDESDLANLSAFALQKLRAPSSAAQDEASAIGQSGAASSDRESPASKRKAKKRKPKVARAKPAENAESELATPRKESSAVSDASDKPLPTSLPGSPCTSGSTSPHSGQHDASTDEQVHSCVVPIIGKNAMYIPEADARRIGCSSAVAFLVPVGENLHVLGAARVAVAHGAAQVLGASIAPHDGFVNACGPEIPRQGGFTVSASRVGALSKPLSPRPGDAGVLQAAAAAWAAERLAEFDEHCAIIIVGDSMEERAARVRVVSSRYCKTTEQVSAHLEQACEEKAVVRIGRRVFVGRFPTGIFVVHPPHDWYRAVSRATRYQKSHFPASCRAILCAGKRNVGKSTLAKFAVNRLQGEYGRVVYVDTDCGQPELHFPGLVGAHVVHGALLAPAVSHSAELPTAPLCVAVFGHTSPESDLERYLALCSGIISTAVEYATQNNLPIVVNTCGWVTGAGFGMLKALVRTVAELTPTSLVAIETDAPTTGDDCDLTGTTDGRGASLGSRVLHALSRLGNIPTGLVATRVRAGTDLPSLGHASSAARLQRAAAFHAGLVGGNGLMGCACARTDSVLLCSGSAAVPSVSSAARIFNGALVYAGRSAMAQRALQGAGGMRYCQGIPPDFQPQGVALVHSIDTSSSCITLRTGNSDTELSECCALVYIGSALDLLPDLAHGYSEQPLHTPYVTSLCTTDTGVGAGSIRSRHNLQRK